MRIEFHRTGAERKALVTALAEILETRPKYKGMPSAAYEVGNFTVTKDGTLEFDDTYEEELLENLLERLADYGIVAASPEMAQNWLTVRSEEVAAESEIEPEPETMGLTVELPREGFTDTALENLRRLVESKERLIRKALAVDSLPIKVTEKRVSFPWFAEVDGDEAKAYTHFITALCDMAKNQKRVTAKEKETENEKYAFRCFLLRLGFIGTEYKTERKVLLRNLSGSAAFKSMPGGNA